MLTLNFPRKLPELISITNYSSNKLFTLGKKWKHLIRIFLTKLLKIDEWNWLHKSSKVCRNQALNFYRCLVKCIWHVYVREVNIFRFSYIIYKNKTVFKKYFFWHFPFIFGHKLIIYTLKVGGEYMNFFHSLYLFYHLNIWNTC